MICNCILWQFNRFVPVYIFVAVLLVMPGPVVVSGSESLVLSVAISTALGQHPEIKALEWALKSEESRLTQAGLIPNPEVEMEVEDISSSGDESWMADATVSLLVTQPVELGGKRSKRQQGAELELKLAELELESLRLSVIHDVKTAFSDVLIAGEKMVLFQGFLETSRQLREAVSQRIQAGKVSPLEGLKTEVEFKLSEMDFENAKREYELTLRRLASAMGTSVVPAGPVTGDLDILAVLPPLERLEPLLATHPDQQKRQVEGDVRDLQYRSEKAAGWPDLSVGAGFHHDRASGDNAYSVRLGIPVALFDRNQGNIRAATFQIKRWHEEARAAEMAAQMALHENYQALSISHARALILKTRIIPSAREALEAARDGYNQGKFGYLEVLDAQRTWFEVNADYLDTLAETIQAEAGIEYLVNRPLSQINSISNERE